MTPTYRSLTFDAFHLRWGGAELSIIYVCGFICQDIVIILASANDALTEMVLKAKPTKVLIGMKSCSALYASSQNIECLRVSWEWSDLGDKFHQMTEHRFELGYLSTCSSSALVLPDRQAQIRMIHNML